MCTDFSDAQDRIGGCVARCGIFPFLSNFQVYDKKFTHIAKLKKGIDDRMNYIFIIGELQMICSSVTAHGLRYLCSYFYIKTKTAISFVFFFFRGSAFAKLSFRCVCLYVRVLMCTMYVRVGCFFSSISSSTISRFIKCLSDSKCNRVKT